jgi:hypothetical protein
MTAAPIPVMVRRKDLQRALDVSSETIRRWLIEGKLPPPDVAVSDQASWWHPVTLERAGFRLWPADPAAASPPTPAAS